MQTLATWVWSGVPPLGDACRIHSTDPPKFPTLEDCAQVCFVSRERQGQGKLAFESVRLTFQNKVTLQDPRVDLTLLQTSGAMEGAETNQGKFLGHSTNAEPYSPASSDDGYPEASLSHSL